MRSTVRLILPFIPVLAFAFAPPADAQYFGRNKVQWEHLKFEVMKTEHFDIYYYPEEQRPRSRRHAWRERWYTRLAACSATRSRSASPSSSTPATPISSRPTSWPASSARARAASPRR